MEERQKEAGKYLSLIILTKARERTVLRVSEHCGEPGNEDLKISPACRLERGIKILIALPPLRRRNVTPTKSSREV